MELLTFSRKITAIATIEAVQNAEVILSAATPAAVNDIAKSLSDFSQKIIIDAMNSVRIKPEGFSNTTEALTELTNCKHIVKCFNTTGFENTLYPVYDNQGIDMFIS